MKCFILNPKIKWKINDELGQREEASMANPAFNCIKTQIHIKTPDFIRLHHFPIDKTNLTKGAMRRTRDEAKKM